MAALPDIRSLLRAPFLNEEEGRRTLLGGILLLPAGIVPAVKFFGLLWKRGFSWGPASIVVFLVTLVPAAFSVGMLLLILKSLLEQSGLPPMCGSLRKVAGWGFRGLVAVLAYLFIPAVVLWLGVIWVLAGWPHLVMGLAALWGACVIGLGVAYVLPWGLCEHVVGDSLASGFRFGAIFRGIRQAGRKYNEAYLVSVGFVVAALAVTGALALTVVAPVIVWPFLAFYVGSVSIRLFATVYERLPPD